MSIIRILDFITTFLTLFFLGSIDLSQVTNLYDNNYTIAIVLDPNNSSQCITNGVTGPCSFTTPPSAPTYNAGICENALVQVHVKFEMILFQFKQWSYFFNIFSYYGQFYLALTIHLIFLDTHCWGQTIQYILWCLTGLLHFSQSTAGHLMVFPHQVEQP